MRLGTKHASFALEKATLATSKALAQAEEIDNRISSLFADTIMLNNTLLGLLDSLKNIQEFEIHLKKKAGKSKKFSVRISS